MNITNNIPMNLEEDYFKAMVQITEALPRAKAGEILFDDLVGIVEEETNLRATDHGPVNQMYPWNMRFIDEEDNIHDVEWDEPLDHFVVTKRQAVYSQPGKFHDYTVDGNGQSDSHANQFQQTQL